MMESAPTPQRTAGPSKNTLALVSLLTGIAGLTIFPFVGGVIAVITGNIARKEIMASSGAQSGEGMARAGLILGWIAIGLGVAIFLVIFNTQIS